MAVPYNSDKPWKGALKSRSNAYQYKLLGLWYTINFYVVKHRAVFHSCPNRQSHNFFLNTPINVCMFSATDILVYECAKNTAFYNLLLSTQGQAPRLLLRPYSKISWSQCHLCLFSSSETYGDADRLGNPCVLCFIPCLNQRYSYKLK